LLFQTNTVTAGFNFAVNLSDSANATINSNTISNTSTTALTFAAGVPTQGGIEVTQGLPATKISATLSNNVITATTGVGIYFAINQVAPGGGANFSATVFGNDVRSTTIGVLVNGDTQAASTAPLGTIDLGGGANKSPGGNVFRTFTKAQAAAGQRFAIAVENAGAAATVSATNNVFDTSTPTDVILDSKNNTANAPPGFGTLANGTINVGSPLTGTAAYINDLYLDFLGNTPDPGGASFWTNVFNTQGAQAVANGIVFSTQGLTRDVNNLYTQILGRAGDSGGVSFWVSQIQGGMSLEQVQANFFGSAEFLNVVSGAGGSSNPNGSLVMTLYADILGRTAAASDVNFWITYLNTHTATQTALAFLTSAEFRTDQVVGYYGQAASQNQGVLTPINLLHRTTVPSQSEVNFWVNSAFNLLQIQAQFAASAEFQANG
jgi:hypothetical protein